MKHSEANGGTAVVVMTGLLFILLQVHFCNVVILHLKQQECPTNVKTKEDHWSVELVVLRDIFQNELNFLKLP